MVGIGGESFGPPGELQQLAARALGPGFGVRAGAEIEGDHVVGVVLVEHRAPAHLVHFLIGGLIHGSTAAQRGGGRSRAGGDAAQQGQRRPVAHPAPALRRRRSSDTYSRAKARMSSKSARYSLLKV